MLAIVVVTSAAVAGIGGLIYGTCDDRAFP
jgi:hypothetical protein